MIIMVRNRILISTATFTSLSLLGFTFAFVGTLLPVMKLFFQINLSSAGLIIVTIQIGYAVFCFLGGIIANALGKVKTLMTGCLCLAIGSLLLGFYPIFWINLFILSLMGIGCGMIFISSNTLIIELFPTKRGTFLNVHHLCFAAASFTGPLIIGCILSSNLKWQFAFKGLSAMSFLLFLLFTVTQTDHPSKTTRTNDYPVYYLLKNRVFRPLAVTGLLIIGAQFAVMYLAVTFLIEAKGFSITSAVWILSLFFLLLALGRIICSVLAAQMANTIILLFLFISTAVFLLLSWVSSGITSGIFLALTGLGFSGVFPGLLALTSLILPERLKGSALGVLSMLGGLGGVILAYITTSIAQRVGLYSGFLVIPAIAAFAAIFFMFHFNKFFTMELAVKKTYKSEGRTYV